MPKGGCCLGLLGLTAKRGEVGGIGGGGDVTDPALELLIVPVLKVIVRLLLKPSHSHSGCCPSSRIGSIVSIIIFSSWSRLSSSASILSRR